MIQHFGSAWAAFGQVTAIVLLAGGTAFGLFRYLGDKWIEARFSESLELFKHQQQKELENLRLKINSALDRAVKLHASEFEALPSVWEKLSQSFNEISAFTSPLQSYPDLNRATKEELEHLLSKQDFAEFQKGEIRESEDKNSVYQKMIFWVNFKKVNATRFVFDDELVKKGIFIREDIRVKIDELSDMMWNALLEKRMEQEHPDPRAGRWEKCEKLRKDGPILLREIRDLIRVRLWDGVQLETEAAK